MLQNNVSLVTLGEVVKVEGSGVPFSDDAGAWRLKVRLDTDGSGISDSDLPDAFPLIPKMLQSVPKVGEGVFILNASLGNNRAQRYYVGPIISQAQFQEYSAYKSGRGDAVSLLATGKPLKEKPLTSIDRARGLTKGSFPNMEDVALIGRGQEDIVLKYKAGDSGQPSPSSEIDLRAGIRLQPSDDSIKYLKGNVVFNDKDPAYIQVKYKKSGLAGLNDGDGDGGKDNYESKSKRTANSVINVVADKINLISHKDSNQFGEKLTNREQLVLEGEIDNIMSQLHRSVYGDELVNLLKLIVKALSTHTHSYSMLPPTIIGTELEELQGYPYEKLLSPNVRIS